MSSVTCRKWWQTKGYRFHVYLRTWVNIRMTYRILYNSLVRFVKPVLRSIITWSPKCDRGLTSLKAEMCWARKETKYVKVHHSAWAFTWLPSKCVKACWNMTAVANPWVNSHSSIFKVRQVIIMHYSVVLIFKQRCYIHASSIIINIIRALFIK